MFSLNNFFIRGSLLVDKWRPILSPGKVASATQTGFIEDIQVFCPKDTPPAKHALISLIPSSWSRALANAPDIKFFNTDGFSYHVVKALNEKGYSVDIADFRDAGFEPRKHYDFYLGHAGHCKGILDRLPPETFVMHYASGAYWKEFNKMSQERYDNFCRRKNLPAVKKFVRSLDGTEEGEEYLVRHANAAFLSGPRTAATFSEVSKNISLLYLGAYVERDFLVTNRDFEAGRKNFVYVAGTSGNVQKGMDLLIEAFSRLPHLHLYIYCKVEEEVQRAYRRELALPNIHYVYHYSKGPLRLRMKKLLRKINFTISAPIDTGPGTAFLGSMGIGLIPVGYVDIEADDTESVRTDSYSIEAIMDAANRASEKSAEWCRLASQKTLERFRRLHDPPSFGANFKMYLDRLGL